MRKGRFAGLSDKGAASVRPPSLAQLLSFDFRPPADEDDERVAAERARALELALPLLAGADFLWSAVLLASLSSVAPSALPAVASVAAALLLLDVGLWLGLRRVAAKPYLAVRCLGAHGFARGALWFGAALLVGFAGGGDSIAVRAALVAGVAAAIPVLFTVPLLMAVAAASTLAVIALLRAEAPLTGIALCVGAFLAGLALLRARHQLLGARERVALEWQSKKARRFVADFEASGRGWFWETSADGILTYASDAFGRHLGLGAGDLLGRRLDEILSVADGEADADARRTLGFHLSAS
jgi:PAS domain-containing protein